MEEAEVSGRQIAVYAPGTWVCVLSTQDEWAYVQSQDGAVGFMEKSALENVHISYRLYGVVHNPSDREFLNLREEPSREAAILGTYYNGVPCLILSHDQDGWCRVRVHGTEGYFREEFIEEKTLPFGEEIATVTPRNKNGVNMRSGPGYIFPASRLCPENSYLTVIEKGNDWWMVSDNGNIGFIHSSLLQEGVVAQRGAIALRVGQNGRVAQVRLDGRQTTQNALDLTFVNQGMSLRELRVALLERVDTAFRVNHRLLPREVRVALRAGVNGHLLARGASLDDVAAGAGDRCLSVGRMYVFFHVFFLILKK